MYWRRTATRLLVGALALGGVAGVWAQQPSRARDPNDPGKARAVVSRAEREAKGLDAKKYAGVHPDVRAAFARTKDEGEFSRLQMPGTVYVQVHFKVECGDEKVSEVTQQRVLERFTAAEFHVAQQFKRCPGLVGYATPEAIDKLAKDPDVVGVWLDEQGLPQQPPVLYGDQIPAAKTGKFADAPGVTDGVVSVKVYETLDSPDHDRAYVLVVLSSDKLPAATHVPSGMSGRSRELKAAVRERQDSVLSALSADDFHLWTRLGGRLPAFAGYINRQGLAKLFAADSAVKDLVVKVGPDELEKTGAMESSPSRPRRKP